MLGRLRTLTALALLAAFALTASALGEGRCTGDAMDPILRKVEQRRMTFVKIMGPPHLVEDYRPLMAPVAKIVAEGNIEVGTADDFRRFLQQNPLPPGTAVYLSSGGGRVDGGLKLGSIIRERGFETAVGRVEGYDTDQGRVVVPVVLPTVCASSCGFAFLGGVKRLVHAGDVFGVHSFYVDRPNDILEVMEQLAAAKIAATSFTKSMGVDPAFVDELAKERSTEAVLGLSKDRLVALRVVTESIVQYTGSSPSLSCGNASDTQKAEEEKRYIDERREHFWEKYREGLERWRALTGH